MRKLVKREMLVGRRREMYEEEDEAVNEMHLSACDVTDNGSLEISIRVTRDLSPSHTPCLFISCPTPALPSLSLSLCLPLHLLLTAHV